MIILRANELFLQYDYLYQPNTEKCPVYSPRDVIVIKEDSELCLAIVLGAIAKGDELRTDAAGMTSYDDIVRHATWEDLDNPDIKPLSMSNRVIQEACWYAIDLRYKTEGQVVYAFDTFARCDYYRKYRGVHDKPIRLPSPPEEDKLRWNLVIIDLLEFFREANRDNAIALKKKYGDAKAYEIFTLDTRSLPLY